LASVSYDATVDTSSIIGTAGFLDFNFNPGPLLTQFASLQILNFTSDGTLGGLRPCGTRDVSGQLPATLTFDNGTGFNDYFEEFKFGSSLVFDVSFYGAALSAPDGVSTSGSTFAFGMFSDVAGTLPTLTSDTADGFAFIVNVNLDGTTTLNNFSLETNVVPLATAVPEPSSLLPIGLAIVLMGVSRVLAIQRHERVERSILLQGKPTPSN
jgi:hypothetical protein